MIKTIFAVDGDITKLEEYKNALKPKLDDRSYILETFRSPHRAYSSTLNFRPGPHLLITAYDFDRYPNMGGSKLIRKVHELSSRTKFIMSSGMHESNVRRILDELKKDGIDVKYVEDNLGDLVKSLIGE